MDVYFHNFARKIRLDRCIYTRFHHRLHHCLRIFHRLDRDFDNLILSHLSRIFDFDKIFQHVLFCRNTIFHLDLEVSHIYHFHSNLLMIHHCNLILRRNMCRHQQVAMVESYSYKKCNRFQGHPLRELRLYTFVFQYYNRHLCEHHIHFYNCLINCYSHDCIQDI